MTDPEAESCPLPDPLSSEERLESIADVVLVDTGAVVGQRISSPFRTAATTSRGFSGSRMASMAILHEIDGHLVQLALIAGDP